MAFVDQLLQDFEVFAPVTNKDLLCFQPIHQSGDLTLNFSNTVKPPKEIFFPQTECLFCASCDDRKAGVIPLPTESSTPRILFGVRPCDARSFHLLDHVFLEDRLPDPYYAERRASTLIIAVGCNQPDPTCFCSSVGGNPFDETGSDLLLIDISEGFVVKPTSPRGVELIERHREHFDRPNQSIMADAEGILRQAQDNMPVIFDIHEVTSNLNNLVTSGFWDQVYEKCVGCSICAYLCPTCHCFDITDEVIESDTVRLRTWDTCAFSYFTLEASGFNPRPTQKERLKNRFMHKFAYFPENFAQIGCVGCGRCIRDCPVNLDIREVLLDIAHLEKSELR